MEFGVRVIGGGGEDGPAVRRLIFDPVEEPDGGRRLQHGLIARRWFVRVPGVELRDCFFGILEVSCWIPGLVLVVEAGPLNSVLELVSVQARAKNFFKLPLLFVVDYRRRWRLVSWNGFGARLCWLGE